MYGETGFGGDDLDPVDIVGRQERVGRAVGEDVVGGLADLALAGDGAVVVAVVAGRALIAGVDADQAPGEVVVDRRWILRAEEDTVDVKRAVGVAVVLVAGTTALGCRRVVR